MSTGTDTTYKGWRLLSLPDTDRCSATFSFKDKYRKNRVAGMFPKKVLWPKCDLDTLRDCIDAMYAADISILHDYIDSYPKHEFGFEDFVRWVERHYIRSRGAVSSLGAKPATLEPKKEKMMVKLDKGDVSVSISAVLFEDDDQWVKILAEKSTGDLLSEIYQEPATNSTYVHRHFPQKYLASGVKPNLLAYIIGQSIPWDRWVDQTMEKDALLSSRPLY